MVSELDIAEGQKELILGKNMEKIIGPDVII